MEVLVERCCGLDVHQATVVACVRRPGPRGRRTAEVRTFGTMTAALLSLADWLTAEGVTPVALESTGIFWKPGFNLLEGQCAVILVNAHHIKAARGRKTDVRDCEWLAQLLEHGLLRASFIPPPPIRELRDLPRHRTVLVHQRVSEANRVQKLLESANIKLKLVVTDVLGASGRAILSALIARERDPSVLANPRRARCARRAPAWQRRSRLASPRIIPSCSRRYSLTVNTSKAPSGASTGVWPRSSRRTPTTWPICRASRGSIATRPRRSWRRSGST